MAVHAHPDDECISTGGILARYAAEGARTILVTCTDGAVGEISDPALATPENLVEVRDKELADSVRILKVSRLVKLGYRDSGMAGTADNEDPRSFARADLEEAIQKVVDVIKEETPQVVVTYNENGGYGHPDHIRAHQVAVGAFNASQGQVWQPAKLYYAVIARSSIRQFADRVRAAGIEVPFRDLQEGEDTPFAVADDRITTHIDVSRFVHTKREALIAHRTQMGPDQFFMRLPEELFSDVFGQETFQRVAGPGPTPERDLFAGLDV
jgi:N-acetyl-1-D-myo-inositol-2-amino-2-deoxy-alpha-D-glucopyranoside deacetylase/mycothiol S-conjugate amidase